MKVCLNCAERILYDCLEGKTVLEERELEILCGSIIINNN
jgi:hypothetical protein